MNGAPIECGLVGVEVENLRGFRKASLRLERNVTVLVGPNNAGKTSLLRLLDWALNMADTDLFSGARTLSSDEVDLLLPARDTRGSARRLTLTVRIPDGRRASRFHTTKNIARLRYRVIGKNVFLAVSRPSRAEQNRSESAALALLDSLQRRTTVLLVPSARDASSIRFRETLRTAIRARLEERGIHTQQGGAPAEYRTLKSSLAEIREVALGLIEPLWSDISEGLIAGLATKGTFSLDPTAQALVDWLVTQTKFTLSTGEHDVREVAAGEVGSGLQSLLDLAVILSISSRPEATLLLLAEEPEAFLHPSAQRSLADLLLRSGQDKRVVSTHSPIVVEEATYGEVVLVRDHRVFEPRIRGEQRAAINTALLAGMGAEAMFSRSVLLVEGPGDRAFFETLRRRVAKADPSGRTHTLAAVDVGGSPRFGPWINLFRSYIDDATGDEPIKWLAIADGIDATTDLVRGLRDGGVSVTANIARLARAINQAFADGDLDAGIDIVESLNTSAEQEAVPMALMPIDLEWAALRMATVGTLRKISTLLGLDTGGKLAPLLQKLGSKHGDGPSNEPLKAAWSRAALAGALPWTQVSPEVVLVMRRWLLGAIDSPQEVDELLGSVL